jgi:rhomboid protease GluP
MQNNNQIRPSTMPCPRCRKLISISSPQCAHCGLRYPKVFASIPLLEELAHGEVSFVKPIILMCLGLYVVSIAINFGGQEASQSPLAIFSPTLDSLKQLGMGGRIPWSEGQWWTLLTAAFLHGDALHIFFNMWWLRDLGPLVEREYGASRFLLIYTTAGLVGSALSTLAGTFYFVGASGAIFGLFGALLYYGWHRGGTFGSAIFRRTLFWAGLLFLYGLAGRNIDNWGHLGGLLGGFAVAALLTYEERLRQTLGHHLGALLTLVFWVVCFSLMLVNFFSTAPA